ncbi:MAG: glycosyltransferase family protein [Acholeplasma sp.]|nr:glycosyltransferase family protein [Acholeplasma sp.]
MKIGAVIQARTGSTRLPGKVLKILEGKMVLEHVIERVKLSKNIDEIIIATTCQDKDDIIEYEALKSGVKVFRGSEDDVLSRYYHAAKFYKLDIVVRITSDCPLIDPYIMDNIITCFCENKFDIVSNASSNPYNRTFPRGLDIEVFYFSHLEAAYNYATEKYQREHVTPYLYERAKNIYYYRNGEDYSNYRWTLDTEDDFLLISRIYEHFYRGKHDFFMSDIIKFLKENPKLISINAHVEQKKLNE